MTLACGNISIAGQGAVASTTTCVSVASLIDSEYEVTLATIAANSCDKITVTGVPELTGDADVWVLHKTGDANADHTADIVDLSVVKSKLFETVDSSNNAQDVNADGELDIVDLSVTKSRLFEPGDCTPPP